MPKVLDIAALEARIGQGIGVAYDDVEEMFKIVKAGGSAEALATAQARIVELEAQLKTASAGTDDSAAQIQALNDQIAANKAQHEALIVERDALQRDNDRLGTLAETAAAKIDELNLRIDELQAALGLATTPQPGPNPTVPPPAPVAPPVALDHSFATDNKTALTGSVAIAGASGLTYSLIGVVPSLEFNSDGSFAYSPTPTGTIPGLLVFDYSVADGQGNSDTGSVTIDVTAAA